MAIIAEWTFSASGNGAAANTASNLPFQITAYGTWGSGTLTLQFSPDGGTTWIDVSGVSLTANGTSGAVGASVGTLIRPVLTGATSPTLSVIANQIVVGQ